MSDNNVKASPGPRTLKRSQSDANSNQINASSIDADKRVSVSREANYPDGRTKIQRMSSIHPLCHTIGGTYNLKTANVMLLCDTADDSDVSIPAHKSILAAGSTVFYRQFYVQSRTFNTFRISNITADVLCKFLTSFYAKSMKIHRDDVPELMQLAYDFDADKCKEICHQFMNKSLDAGIDDVLWILKLALEHDCTVIYDRCIEKIHHHGVHLIETDAFLTCNRSVFKTVVRNVFVGRNDEKLFAACVKWGNRRINRKKSTSHKKIRREIDEIRRISKAIADNRCDRLLNDRHQEMAEPKIIPRGKLFTIRHVFESPLPDFRKLYNDNHSADMVFVFESNDVRIAAHKCILATKSEIFEERLFEIDGPVEVLVKSATPRTFSAFLKLLYGYEIGEIAQQMNFEAILGLAYEYGAMDIFKGQEIQLKQFATLETLFWAANLSRKYRFVDTMKFNCKWIQKHASKFDLNLAFHSMALIGCSREVVEHALDIDYRNRNAMRIFEAVINWAKNRCQQSKSDSTVTPTNLRRKMDNILMLIPFHEMTRPEFDACQDSYPGLLNETDIQEVLEKMTADSNGTASVQDDQYEKC